MTEQDQAKVWTLALGGAGAVVSLGFQRKTNALKAVLSVVGGTATAYVCAPLCNSWIPAHSQESLAAVAFFAGLGGMKLCEAVYRVIDRRAEPLIDGQIDRLPGIRRSGEHQGENVDTEQEKSKGEDENV